MLQRILLILSIICSLSLCTASAENWVYIDGVNYGSTTVFIDRDSIEKNKDTATLWVKFLEKSGFSISSKVELYENDLTYTPIQGIVKTSNFHTDWQGDLDHVKKQIQPNSAMEAVYNFIWPPKEDWSKISDTYFDKRYVITYIDLKSIEKNDDTATVWIKITNDNSYLFLKNEFHKQSHTVTTLRYKYYIAGKVFDKEPTSDDSKNEPIRPDSDYQLIYDYLFK